MKIRTVGDKLFDADGQTNKAKVIVDFHEFRERA
jgi:hypothetical protein